MVCDRATDAKWGHASRVLEFPSLLRKREISGDFMNVETPIDDAAAVEETLGRPEEWLHLDQLQLEHCGLVAAVQAGEEEIERLKSMGVCVGRRLMLVRSGDPMIVKVLGSRIGISARLAQRVMVLPCGGDAFGDA